MLGKNLIVPETDKEKFKKQGGNMPEISIIIPAYNAEKEIVRCIDSILNQTYNCFEIIIIDDGSTDRTLEICKKYAEKDVRILVKSQENKGVSATRNLGLNLSRGKYICFVDADDYLDCRYLEILLKNILKTNADISMCKWSRNGIDQTNIELSEEVWDKENTFYQFFKYGKIDGAICCKLYRREIVQNIYFNDKIRLGEDQMFAIQAIERSEKVVFQNISLYAYMYNEASAMNTTVDERYWDAVYRAEWLVDEAQKFNPQLIDLFKKEEISIYLYLMIMSYKAENDEARKIAECVIQRIKNSNTKDFKDYSNTSDFIQYILIKYFEPLAHILVKIKQKLL